MLFPQALTLLARLLLEESRMQYAAALHKKCTMPVGGAQIGRLQAKAEILLGLAGKLLDLAKSGQNHPPVASWPEVCASSSSARWQQSSVNVLHRGYSRGGSVVPSQNGALMSRADRAFDVHNLAIRRRLALAFRRIGRLSAVIV